MSDNAQCARHPLDCSVEQHAQEWRDEATRLRAENAALQSAVTAAEAQRDKFRWSTERFGRDAASAEAKIAAAVELCDELVGKPYWSMPDALAAVRSRLTGSAETPPADTHRCRWDGFGYCLEHNAPVDPERPQGTLARCTWETAAAVSTPPPAAAAWGEWTATLPVNPDDLLTDAEKAALKIHLAMLADQRRRVEAEDRDVVISAGEAVSTPPPGPAAETCEHCGQVTARKHYCHQQREAPGPQTHEFARCTLDGCYVDNSEHCARCGRPQRDAVHQQADAPAEIEHHPNCGASWYPMHPCGCQPPAGRDGGAST